MLVTVFVAIKATVGLLKTMIDLKEQLEGLDIVEEGRHHVADPKLVNLAVRIAELYTDGCTQAIGHSQKFGVRSLKHLYNAAKLCDSYGETPELFVAKQIRGMLKYSKLWVNALASAAVHTSSEEDSNITLDSIRYYKSQLALFGARSRLYGPALAIEDEANDFSPLFRYVLASDLGLKHVADSYATAALKELSNNPVAKDIFGHRVGTLAGSEAHRSSLPTASCSDIEVNLDS